MASRLTEVIFDCHDLARSSNFWCNALGYEQVSAGDGWISIRDPSVELTDEMLSDAPQSPALAFVLVPEEKILKNRVHIDLTPIDCSQEEEVRRLMELGAHPIDIGQRGTSWIVMADPEGNEFCVMESILE
jgi:catechol 2,3-dioxygenase-like lactoylglutathione lyase family enzyme